MSRSVPENVVAWCHEQESLLLRFPQRAVRPDGRAVVLDAAGGDSGELSPTYLTARMAHVHALAHLRGHVGHLDIAGQLLQRLLHDGAECWTDEPTRGARRSLYALDHVILAAASGSIAGLPGANELLEVGLREFEGTFWDSAVQRPIDHLDGRGAPAQYRGMNSTMHLTEALFAAADATGEHYLSDRALSLCRLALTFAQERQMRLCEHYDREWRALPEFHRDQPDDTFQPFGSTPGHGFEWSRLLAQASQRPGANDLLAGAAAMYDRAAEDSTRRLAAPGLIYTVDFDGTPVSTRRLWWVAAEAFAAASVLHRLGAPSPRVEADVLQWRDLIRDTFVDPGRGSWVHDLDQPDGPKSDLYHCFQAVLIPQLPISTSVAASARRV